MPSLLANEDATADAYLEGTAIKPLFLCGDALDVLQTLPASYVDCVMTSPPYWSQRAYSGGRGHAQIVTMGVSDSSLSQKAGRPNPGSRRRSGKRNSSIG